MDPKSLPEKLCASAWSESSDLMRRRLQRLRRHPSPGQGQKSLIIALGLASGMYRSLTQMIVTFDSFARLRRNQRLKFFWVKDLI
jgi:hypothetical protein